MEFCIQGFLGKQHSWSVVNQNIARELHNAGHNVDLESTNGMTCVPNDIFPLFKTLKNHYDAQLSYTAMINFPKYLSHGSKNRFGIWNYEFTKLPLGHAKYVKFIDWFLPSSQFSYQIFAENGVSTNKMKVISHGINYKKYQEAKPLQLNTKKSFKILANIAQPHIRKNLPGLLEAYGKAFSKKDDVCLILKVVDKIPEKSFEVSFSKQFSLFKQKYPNSAECLILKSFITDIESLYKSVDVVFTMTHAECFYLPGLEGLAAGNIVISPKYGGQLDFLNENNSLLIDGKMIAAPLVAQYWDGQKNSEMFDPNIDEAVEKLKFAYNNAKELKLKFQENSKTILQNFTWNKVVSDILNLTI